MSILSFDAFAKALGVDAQLKFDSPGAELQCNSRELETCEIGLMDTLKELGVRDKSSHASRIQSID